MEQQDQYLLEMHIHMLAEVVFVPTQISADMFRATIQQQELRLILKMELEA